MVSLKLGEINFIKDALVIIIPNKKLKIIADKAYSSKFN
jgi:hypothetical protein